MSESSSGVVPASCPHATATVGASYEPFDPAFRDDPYPFYARAREEEPVSYNPQFGVWLVTRHEDLVAISKDTARFCSKHNMDYLIPLPPEVRAILDEGYPTAPGLFNNDPPGHTRVRALFSAAFTPRRIGELEPRVRALTHELIDGFVGEGRADLMARLAYPLPMTVIADLLGVPRADMPQIKAWHQQWVSLFAPAESLEAQIAAAHDAVAYQRYYAAMIEDRRINPRNDLVTAMVQARFEDAEPFTVAEMISQLLILLSAGHETTTSLIGNVVRLLLQHPEQWQALDHDPGLIPAAIEETLRLDSPVQMEPRVTTMPVEIGGVQVPEGVRVQLFYGSANHDAAVFEQPDEFNIHRTNLHRHVAFGHGIHFCIGSALARLESRVALEVVRERLPNLRLAPDYTLSYEPSLFFRNPCEILVEWDAPAA
jgi:cytochrome P450